MKVRELAEILSKCDPEMECVVSRDEEGNGFHSLTDVEPSAAVDDRWEWNVVHPDDEDSYDDLVRVLVFWP